MSVGMSFEDLEASLHLISLLSDLAAMPCCYDGHYPPGFFSCEKVSNTVEEILDINF